MDPLLQEWLNLVVRWAHVMFGIAWIGASLYFMWLDAALEKPDPPREGVAGELWSVHGGGFYHAQKFAVAPPRLPARLHWFKWEAGFTLITGLVLLALVFYVGMGGALYSDPRLAGLGTVAGLLAFAVLLAVAWAVYDALFKSEFARARPPAAASVGFALLVVVMWLLCRSMQPQAAYIHVGALVGTIMVANVFMIIIPGQRLMVEALGAGRAPDPERGRQGKIRSTHNSYLTLPIVFTMLSKNFSSAWGSEYNWIILAGVFVVGGVVRHWFILHDRGQSARGRWIWPAAGVAMVALYLVARSG